MDDRCMLTHDKSSHGLWPGELKKNVGKKSQEKQSWTKSHRKKSQYRYLGKYLLDRFFKTIFVF